MPWKDSHEFAEVAEAIGIDTFHVLAAMALSGDAGMKADDIVAIFADVEDESVCFTVHLQRDDDRILRIASGPHRLKATTSEVEQRLHEMEGEPDEGE